MADTPTDSPVPTIVNRHKGRKPKLMRPTADRRWSSAADAIFLEALGASCNVRWSAAQAGFTTSVVYRQRARRPEFAERWESALQQGYARLEMALVRSAADTMEGIPLEPEHPIPPTTVAEALNLLKLHAANVGRPGYVFGHFAPTRSMEELREGIQRKIDAIRRHRKAPPA